MLEHPPHVYEQTRGGPTLTAVRIGDEVCDVWELPLRHGITVDQWHRRKEVAEQATYCSVGGMALTLEQFEAQHPMIELGTN
jgi:hypothetical protein